MISLILAAALLAGEPAAAAPAKADAAKSDASKPDKAKKPALICHKEVVLGSNLPVRVCQTQAEADQRRADSRDELENVQRNQPYDGR